MPRRRIIYALLTLSALLLLGVGRLCAQFHPVHASVVWASPRTPYLPDFYSGSRDRLVVTLTNRDATQPVLHVRMRVRIRCGTGELRSREELPYPHIVLSTGIPHRITNTDLAAYLQPDRLTNAHILRNGQLPDGFTEISVQAVDLFTGKALSDWHTARSHLSVNKPPFLIAPERDATVALTEPTAILFRWQPRLATATEYEFTLKELPSTGESPQGAFPYGHVVHRETVRGTMLSYTHLHPPLIANRLYAWQIRAIQRDGIDEVSTYENGGYSEVSWFRLTDGCAAPTHLHAHTRTSRADFTWRDVQGATGYTIQIRPKTRFNIYDWDTHPSSGSPHTFRGFQPGATYEWRVGATCMGIEPVYSEAQTFTLNERDEELLKDCGKVPETPKGVSQEPHLAIKVGDVVITGGDYPLTITEIEPLGDGWYAGRGRTRLRTFVDMPVAMRFDSLRINVDYRQIGGVVEVMSRAESQFLLEADAVPDPPSLRIRELDFTLADTPEFTFDPQTGELRTTDAAGNPQTIALDVPPNGWESAFPLKIADDDGNMYELTLGERGEDEVQQIVVRDLHIEDEPYDASALSGYHWALDSLRLPNCSNIHEVRTGQSVRLALCHADRRLLDSITLRVGDNTFKDTTATIRYTDYQTPITIQAQRKLQGCDTVVATLTINTHNAPILTFGTLSGYDGEFGYDDGLKFSKTKTPISVARYSYRTFHFESEAGIKVDTCPFITIANGQSLILSAEISEGIYDNKFDYIAELEAYYKGRKKSVNIPYDRKKVEIKYIEESDSIFISIYCISNHKVKPKLLGKCEILQRKYVKKHINVVVVYFQTDSSLFKNKINCLKLSNVLNTKSHNQSFMQFNVYEYNNGIPIYAPHMYSKIKSFGRNTTKILSSIREEMAILTGMKEICEKFDDKIFVIMTDVSFKPDENGSVPGGGAFPNKPVIAMWDVLTNEDINRLIAHEIGHCLGLSDTFSDMYLGHPLQGHTLDNYMDYYVPRRRFFKSQIMQVINSHYDRLNKKSTENEKDY